MISDRTIDAANAKYYCMFSGKQFKSLVQRAKESPEYKAQAEEIIANKVKQATSTNESELNEFGPALVYAAPYAYQTAVAVGAIVMYWLGAKIVTSAPSVLATKPEQLTQAIATTSAAELA